MNLYRTSDIAASVRRAHDAFTHTLVNTSYACVRPILFDSQKLDVELTCFASWQSASFTRRDRWLAKGGVLLDRSSTPNLAGDTDVLIFVECPLTFKRIERAMHVAREGIVIPVPITWSQHELTIDLRHPPVERLQAIWKHVRGRRLTDDELADAAGVPRSDLMYMRNSFRPRKEWTMKPRLAPEPGGLTPAWEWINAGDGDRAIGSTVRTTRKAVRLAGHLDAVHELARRGHITLVKHQVYGKEEPNWTVLERRRASALADFTTVRAIVESLPDYLAV